MKHKINKSFLQSITAEIHEKLFDFQNSFLTHHESVDGFLKEARLNSSKHVSEVNRDILIETGITVNKIRTLNHLISEQIHYQVHENGGSNFCIRKMFFKHRQLASDGGKELSICCENASAKLRNLAQENIFTMVNINQRQSTSAIKWTLNEIAHTNPVTRLNSVFNYLQSVYNHTSSWNNGDGKDLLFEQIERLQFNARFLYQDFIQCSVYAYNNFTLNAIGIVYELQMC